MIEKVSHKTKLTCPDSEIQDYMEAIQCDFWLDEQDVWNVNCHVCGGEHHLGDTLRQPADTVDKKRN